MLLVKTVVKKSKINGLGLFADQYIPAKTVTWRFDPRFDICFDPKQVESMPEIQRNLITNYSYLSKLTGSYVYSIDNTRFANHSKKPNIDNTQVLPGDTEICGIAKVDIYPGDEMTVDYKEIDAADAESDEEYLK